ncbi:MAG TPA: transporter [Stellaceae bacterium]|nr:transporter [Stellaceae bacterium]
MWLYAFIPAAVATAGAVYTVLRPPSDKTVGAVQHFAAGVIFYAAAGELLPDATRHGLIWPIIAGGAVGILAMLLLRHGAEKVRGPAGLAGASAIDALIDGLVLGLGFMAGQHQGVLLAIALAIEFLFLGLSLAAAFGQGSSRWLVIGTTAGIALMVPLGALIAKPIGALPASYRTAAFAFGLIALLYLVTEELLVEAHEKPETAWGAALFFVGFLALTVLDQLLDK